MDIVFRAEKEYALINQQLQTDLEKKNHVIGKLSKQLELHQKNFDELKDELNKVGARSGQNSPMSRGVIVGLTVLFILFFFIFLFLSISKSLLQVTPDLPEVHKITISNNCYFVMWLIGNHFIQFLLLRIRTELESWCI